MLMYSDIHELDDYRDSSQDHSFNSSSIATITTPIPEKLGRFVKCNKNQESVIC